MLQGGTTILIVDDTPVNLKLLANVLSRQHYEVRAALNGPTALQLAETNPPDLILLDIAMPQMDGYTVCRKLKANPKTRDIPIIFISAMTDTGDILRGFELGGVDYITKPFRLKEVMARVESHLTLLRQRREIAGIHERDKQQFARMNALRNQLIGTATHDLKNPLSVITGHAYLLQRHSALTGDEVAQGYIDMINRASSRMHRLIKNMFDLIQIESQTDVEMTSVALPEFLRLCHEAMRGKAEARRIQLALCDVPEVEIMAEVDWLSEAVEHLVSNAIKFSPDDSTITLSATRGSDFTIIEVADTGTGIAAEDIPLLFDAFYRVRSAQGSEDGSGLGLSIVKAIMNQHQGQVQVESKPGEGSRFRLLLPVPAPEAVAGPSELDNSLDALNELDDDFD